MKRLRMTGLLLLLALLLPSPKSHSWEPASRPVASAQGDVPLFYAPVDAVIDIDLGLVDDQITRRVDIEGNLLFWLVSGRLSIYDRHAADLAQPLAVLSIGHQIADLKLVGAVLAVAPKSVSRILLYDPSDPAAPEMLPSLPAHRPVEFLASDGNLLYAVGDAGIGMRLPTPALVERIDLSDPNAPLQSALRIPDGTAILGLVAGEGWLAIALSPQPRVTPERGIVTVLRPRDGYGPEVLFHLPLNLDCSPGPLVGDCRPDFAQMDIDQQRLLVHDRGGVRVYDLSGADPTRLQVEAYLGRHRSAPARSELHNGRLHIFNYLRKEEGGPAIHADVYDIDIPGTARLLGQIVFPDAFQPSARRFDLGEGLVCEQVIDYPPRSPRCWDMSRPAEAVPLAPLELGWVAGDGGADPASLLQGGPWLTLSARDPSARATHFYEVPAGAPPRFAFTNSELRRWAVKDDLIFASIDDAELQVYRIHDPTKVQLLAFYCPDEGTCPAGPAWDGQQFDQLIAEGDRLFALASNQLLLIYDVSSPRRPQERARLSLPYRVELAELLPGGQFILAMALWGRPSMLIDISDPDAPALSAVFEPDPYGSFLRTSGNVMVGTRTDRLIFHDISNPLTPVFQGSYPYSQDPPLVPVLHGNQAYWVREGRIEQIDFSDPSKPRLTAQIIELRAGRLDLLTDGRLVVFPPDNPDTSYVRVLGTPRPRPDRFLPTPLDGMPATATATQTSATPLPTTTSTPTPVLVPSPSPSLPPIQPSPTWSPTPFLTAGPPSTDTPIRPTAKPTDSPTPQPSRLYLPMLLLGR